MGLEQWDERRGKWVLYRTQDEHSDDAAKYPFERVPRRVFLDTNVVNLLVRQSEQIFERVRISDEVDYTSALDTEALMHVFHVGARAEWDIVASAKTLDEVLRTPDANLRADLLEYVTMLVEVSGEEAAYARSLGRRIVDAPFVAALPDVADRELIGNAIGLGCDVFCTCDRRTIVKRRHLLRQLPLRILTPCEWWSHVKPWAGLWN